MEILQQFPASLTSPTVPVVHAMQYDAGRQLRLRLYSGATEWAVPDGVTAGVSYTLPDRSKGYFEQLSDGSAACTIEGNAVTAVVAPVMVSGAGTVKAAIVLRQGDTQISTFPFRIQVTARPGAVTAPEAQPDAVSVFAGKIFYGAASGMATPLGIGDGLEIQDGMLRALADPNAATKTYVDDAVAELWAEIRYVPIAISYFRHNAGTVELGARLDAVELSWSLNKDPVRQTLNDAIVVNKARALTQRGLFVETTKFTLAVTDEREATDTASTTVYFYPGVYYGAMDADTQIDSAAILALTRTLRGDRKITFTADCGGLRPVFACPSRFGTPAFTIGGFAYDWTKMATLHFTNASGHTEAYDVWMHGQDVAGSITVTVS